MIFSPFCQLVGSRLLHSLSSISLLYRTQFAFFMLMLERCCIGLIVTYICKLMRIGRWSEPRFVFVCQLVEVIREGDANKTSWAPGLALTGNLVGESQLRIPMLEEIQCTRGNNKILRTPPPHIRSSEEILPASSPFLKSYYYISLVCDLRAKRLVACLVTPALWLNLSDSTNILIIHFGLLLKERTLDSIGHDLWKNIT